jgi:uncharacterized protein (DUF58 family)
MMKTNAQLRVPWFRRYLYHNFRVYSAFGFWLRRRFTKAGLLVLAGVIVTGARFDTNLSVGYQAFCLLFGLLLLAFFGSTRTRMRFSAQRMLPRLASVGTPVTYRIAIKNLTRRALRNAYLIENIADPRPTLQDFAAIPEPLEQQRNWLDRTYGFYRWRWLLRRNLHGSLEEQPVPMVPAQGRAEVAMELRPTRRGVMRFEGLTLSSPEPFGLCRTFVKCSLPQTLLILPKRYWLPPIALPGTMKYQAGGMALASSVGESEEFMALRDYRPGDPPRRIHWRSWAKMGRPIVKEFEDEFFVRHALILDTFCEPPEGDLFEEAVSVAASFACSLQTQDSLLDLLFVGPQAFCFTIGRGLAHTEQMLEILASVQPCHEQTFNTLLRLVLEHSGVVSGCVCVFLHWDASRKELVDRLLGLSVPVLVLVIVRDGGSAELDPGPMRACPDCFHALEVSKIAEQLASLEIPGWH